MNNIIDISVHQLVDFLLRKGDLDDRIFNTGTMEEGSKIHRSFQKKQGEDYISEVDLKTTLKVGDYVINLHGRADGIIISKTITIEEIKSTNTSIFEFNETNEEWHLGQAECYAYMYCKEKNLTNIDIKLTYISQISHKSFSKVFNYSFSLLEDKINEYLSKYLDFYSMIDKQTRMRNSSIKSLVFPFSLRKGQSEIIKDSESSIKTKQNLFIEASTGLGKTISIVFGVLKGLVKTDVNKLFFLTAKNSGFKSADDCLKILRDDGLFIRSCEIIAKEKMCINKNHNCNPDDCPFAVDYFTKRNSILLDTLCKYQRFDSYTILKIASDNQICPFEFSLDLSLYCDFIVADYNYVFNPISYLKRFFDTLDYKSNNFLMVDEAHNLIDRSREMYSSSICYQEFLRMYNAYSKIKSKSIKDDLKQLSQDFDLFDKFEVDENNVLLEKLDDEFLKHLNEFQTCIRDYKKRHPKFKCEDGKDFELAVFKFLTIYDYFGDNYRIYYKKDGSDFSIVLKCVDASPYINQRVAMTNGAIFFSGTLTPISYYMKGILGNDEYKTLELTSPFDSNNLKLLVNSNISIRYKNRTNTLMDVIKYINQFVDKKIGNYIVYVPSFEYLYMLKDNFSNNKINLIFQEGSMDKIDKENFLNCFKSNPKKTTLGVCVLGGSFSEGIDLVSDRLIGVIIVGVGLPSISFDNYLIKDYYDKKDINGYTFAYVNPGINKVMQAVGRLIRSENDRGIALLIDDRYKTKTYKELFEVSWKNNKFINSLDTLEKELNSFYKQ